MAERRYTEARTRPTLLQRMALSRLRREAGRKGGEPLTPADGELLWNMHAGTLGGWLSQLLPALPRGQRCAMCGAPFGSPGSWLVGPLGFRPSRKNPTVCRTCIELSPPGGMLLHTGVLFADLRGFTERTAGDPQAASRLLARFYRRAEDVLFPDAVIDKLIGDEVMALYLPAFKPQMRDEDVPALMVEHARRLLAEVGYGVPAGPFVEVGIGLDIGEAFVGNIGQRALYDFTAVGDVVNVASRLQAQAAGGEIVLSQRVADGLRQPLGAPAGLALKGRPEPEAAYRITL